MVELGLVGEHVRVGARRHGEVALPDVLADPCPRHAAHVLILRCLKSCGENVGTPAAVQARVMAVRNRSPPKP